MCVKLGGEESGSTRWWWGGRAVAQLVLPLPFRGNDIEHGETATRWTPVVLAGYPALGLSGAADPLEASVVAWLTPFGEPEWELMRGSSLPDLGLAEGTLVPRNAG